MSELIFLCILVVLLVVASAIDWQTGRIPNWLTFPSMVCGVGGHTILQGVEGLLFSLKGIGLGIGLLLAFYLAGGMGGGDVKLQGAVGGLVGPGGIFSVFLMTALLWGISSFILLVARWGLGSSIRYVGGMLKWLALSGQLRRALSPTSPTRHSLQYAPILAMGTLLSKWWPGGW